MGTKTKQKTIEYPEVTDLDMAFGITPSSVMLAIAKERGFYSGHTPYNDLFSKIFFSGGKLNFKKDLNPEVAEKAFRYLKAVMCSFSSKHEVKEAVSAMVLSEICNP